MKGIRLSFCALSIVAAAFGQGTVLWDERIDGPLGTTPGSATSFNLIGLGTNSILGATEIEPFGGNYLVHDDNFLLTVPDNSLVSQLSLTIDLGGVAVWFGSRDFNTLYGYTPNASSGDLLSQLSMPAPGPGTYSMYLANHNSGAAPATATYRLDFVLTPVPEPGTLALLALGGAALVWRGFRRNPK